MTKMAPLAGFISRELRERRSLTEKVTEAIDSLDQESQSALFDDFVRSYRHAAGLDGGRRYGISRRPDQEVKGAYLLALCYLCEKLL